MEHQPLATLPDQTQISGDRLVMELRRLGVRYLSLGSLPDDDTPLTPEALVTGLATSGEARLNMALVPLFLWRRDYAGCAADVALRLSGKQLTMLLCCYSAAVALQVRHARKLAEFGRDTRPLPDLFATKLGIAPMHDPNARLAAVAARHAELSGEPLNWLGSYEHAAKAFLRFASPMPV